MAHVNNSFKVSHISDLSPTTIRLIRTEYGRGDFTHSNNEEVEDLFQFDKLLTLLEDKLEHPEERGEGFADRDYQRALNDLRSSGIIMVAPDYISIDSLG